MAGKGFFYPGGRKGVLLIHGLTGTPTEMKHIGKGLARRGFTVYGAQLAGHCGTEADLLATGWQDWYRSIESAMFVLCSCVDHVFAAGLSMGAILALHLAAKHPDKVGGLGLYSTSFWYDGWSTPPLARFLPLLMRLPFGRRYRFMEAFPYGVKDERIRQWVLNHMQQGGSSQAGLLGTPGPSPLDTDADARPPLQRRRPDQRSQRRLRRTHARRAGEEGHARRFLSLDYDRP